MLASACECTEYGESGDMVSNGDGGGDITVAGDGAGCDAAADEEYADSHSRCWGRKGYVMMDKGGCAGRTLM